MSDFRGTQSIVTRQSITDAIAWGHHREDWPVAAIWGPSGSGKTIASQVVAAAWPGTALYLNGSTERSVQEGLLDLLEPSESVRLRAEATTEEILNRVALLINSLPCLFVIDDIDDLALVHKLLGLIVVNGERNSTLTLRPHHAVIVVTHSVDVAVFAAKADAAVANASQLTEYESASVFCSRFAIECPTAHELLTLRTLAAKFCGNRAWLVNRCAQTFALSNRDAAVDVDFLQRWFEQEWRVTAEFHSLHTPRQVFDATIAQARKVHPIEANILAFCVKLLSQLLRDVDGDSSIPPQLVQCVVRYGLSTMGEQAPELMLRKITSIVQLGTRLGVFTDTENQRIKKRVINIHRLDIEGAWGMQADNRLRELAVYHWIQVADGALEKRDWPDLRMLSVMNGDAAAPSGKLDAQYFQRKGEVFREIGNPTLSKQYLESSLQPFLQVFEKGHPQIAASLCELGHTLNTLGDSEGALELYQRTKH